MTRAAGTDATRTTATEPTSTDSTATDSTAAGATATRADAAGAGAAEAAGRLRVGLFTREYPPSVYGGAGVHVEFLARALRPLVDLRVHCWAEPGAKPPAEPDAVPHTHSAALDHAELALRVLSTDLAMVDAAAGVQLVHSHTWYANLAGHLAKLLHGVPHVMTAHSLEPLRPWKAADLRGGYQVSRWIEQTSVEAADAVIAVSEGMRRDLIDCYPALAEHPERVDVVHNGIDTGLFRPVPEADALRRHGIDPERPTVLFVGRITHQKGVPRLLRAARKFDPGAQLVLCAGAPDSKALDEEFRALAGELRRSREHVFWIPEMLPRKELVQFLSHAAVFVCPSVYEPLGIVNLEAMACGTAVVASDVGGIPEVVEDGRTGLLVPQDGGAGRSGEAGFEEGLAEAVNSLIGHPERAAEFGRAGRERAVAEFGWDTIAARTVEVYRRALAGPADRGNDAVTAVKSQAAEGR